MSKVFYKPGERWVYDSVVVRDGKEVGEFCNQTLEQAKAKEPDLICIEKEECVRQIVANVTRPAQEISAETFKEMLDILPPCAWVRQASSESFHMSEFDVFDVTGIYVRIGRRYFVLRDTYKLAHDERIAKVRETFPDA